MVESIDIYRSLDIYIGAVTESSKISKFLPYHFNPSKAGTFESTFSW